MDRNEIVDGRARKYYRLTDEGNALLRAETQRADRSGGRRRGPVIRPAGTG
ncbi:hypothetical protein ACLQ24_00050 [Micromonospora sp. DT4]|uniref:hypothetical protein n=1 Tax=Micromonospora sp. DT4 TaxID=3393438 RepID=UPI003CF3500D